MTAIRIALAALVPAALLCAQLPSQTVGAYEISLRPPPGGLSAAEEMQLEFRIVNAAKADPVPVIRAAIETTIDMPAMPAMPKLVETAHPESVPGDYGIHPTFAHGGEYRIRMKIALPAVEAFSVEFPLTVLDAGVRKSVKPRFRLEARSEPKKPRAGEPFKLSLTVFERDASQPFADFEIMHEKRMHLVVIRKDLTGFRHEHPDLTQNGSFVLDSAFAEPGEYHLFADVAPRGAGSQVLFASLTIGGKKIGGNAAPSKSEAPPPATLVQLDPAGRVETGRTRTVSALFRDAANGEPVKDLGTYLGAKAHFILIHQDALTFVHSHPDERPSAAAADGVVPFLVRLPKPGMYRGWLQYVRAGVLHTTELQVEGGS